MPPDRFQISGVRSINGAKPLICLRQIRRSAASSTIRPRWDSSLARIRSARKRISGSGDCSARRSSSTGSGNIATSAAEASSRSRNLPLPNCSISCSVFRSRSLLGAESADSVQDPLAPAEIRRRAASRRRRRPARPPSSRRRRKAQEEQPIAFARKFSTERPGQRRPLDLLLTVHKAVVNVIVRGPLR